ncbi:DUF2069 domain-containing protein [Lysobacter silvisoli]|uniref:DUF2069 domain-containing protein n=1 Tax=Lysobacter silvisoli TaxID=2293254 RepID=A0A371K6P0_9GAMM|nr:DUF2069 domain-containing protein [Lysobacter silvisoli]RDZ29619.1 DUF2069 domain-containing protein [Lysobacter silvisoli]
MLLGSLLALAALYAAWFGVAADWVALAVFALPPAWLALGVWRGGARAGFWSAVLALAWFSHGVMVAWSRPPERLYAWAELLLAVAVVFSASLPGLRLRFGAKPGA